MPLVVALPGDLTPRQVKHSVSTIDLLPTLAGIARDGRAEDYAAPVDGRSLLPHLSGTGGHDEVLGEYFAEGAVAYLDSLGVPGVTWTPAAPDEAARAA